jgi:glycosyltransferase involved in cell wall biosynthesis
VNTATAHDLVVFGEDWGGHPSSTQHLVRRLSGQRRVVWVNSIGLRRPRLDRADLARLGRKLLALVRRVPMPGHPVARRVNRGLFRRLLRDARVRGGVQRPVLWLSLPTAVDAIGSADERAVVYYCGDDFAALDGVDHAPVARLEEDHKTHLVEHGVDFERFATPTPRAADLPTDRPVAGFYGSLSNWLDVELLAATAQRLPDWRFVMIGPERTDLAPLRRLANVTLLGPRDHATLPGYAQHWDAALLPFRDTAQIRACNPLKLREYLAAGRPVVTTEFPALDGYRDLVRVADSPEAMATALEAARAEGLARVEERRARVADQSWDRRAADVAALLDAL